MTETSVIGAGTVVSGHVRGQGSLEILGRVEGDVSVSGNVSIGPSGRVRGNVSGAELTVSGQVQGDLRGTLSVLLEPGARVAGDISGPRVGIAPGALARGHVQTDGEPALAAARAPAAAARPVVLPNRAVPAPAPLPPAIRHEAKAPLPPPAKSEAKAPLPLPTRLEAKAPLPPPPHNAPPPKPEARKPEPPRVPPAPPQAEFTPVRPIKPEARRPPPPVVPVISKGTKAKKKKSND